MPVKRRIPKARRDDYPPPWEDRPISRARWTRHRERLMAYDHPGKRPEEWWQYESPRPYSRDVNESLQLFDMGQLTALELAELTPTWRHHYDRAQHPEHFYCKGPNKFLLGDAGRAATYQWFGIPPEYIERWDAERVAAVRKMTGDESVQVQVLNRADAQTETKK